MYLAHWQVIWPWTETTAVDQSPVPLRHGGAGAPGGSEGLGLPPTFIDRIRHGNSNPDTVCCFGALWLGEIFTVWQLQPHQNHGIWSCKNVLCLTQDIFQDFTFIATQVTGLWDGWGFVTVREGVVAQGRDGELRTLIRQVTGGANHGEGSWKTNTVVNSQGQGLIFGHWANKYPM